MSSETQRSRFAPYRVVYVTLIFVAAQCYQHLGRYYQNLQVRFVAGMSTVIQYNRTTSGRNSSLENLTAATMPTRSPEESVETLHVKGTMVEKLRDFPYPYNETQCLNCTYPQPIVGFWANRSKDEPFFAPICCSWDNPAINDATWCASTSLKDTKMYSGLANLYQQVGGHGCECRSFRDNYIWKSPELPTFDPFDACRRLGNRRVFVIGDSTVQQAATTLMNALYPGGCQTQITLALSDTLVNKKMGHLNRGLPLETIVQENHPDIVIYGVGAHIYGEDNFVKTFTSVLNFLQRYAEQNPSFRFAYRTQHPGGCSENIPSIYPDAAIQQQNLTGWYQYDMFYGRDMFAIAKLQYLNLPFIDLRMLYSRSDAKISSHRLQDKSPDCLHMCSPGPLDIMATLFYNLLMHDFGRSAEHFSNISEH